MRQRLYSKSTTLALMVTFFLIPVSLALMVFNVEQMRSAGGSNMKSFRNSSFVARMLTQGHKGLFLLMVLLCAVLLLLSGELASSFFFFRKITEKKMRPGRGLSICKTIWSGNRKDF